LRENVPVLTGEEEKRPTFVESENILSRLLFVVAYHIKNLSCLASSEMDLRVSVLGC
jgi:hypothetical protein